MDPKLLAAEIRKTGFVLENEIAEHLKAGGWTVISNKYYVDDSEETVREIDLVAYRVSKVQHFDVYTTLIISCKKSDSNVWALLARDINLKDPNADWWPLHAWSNDKALGFQLSEGSKPRRYHEQVVSLGVTEALGVPSVEVFAFQEMNKVTGKPQNDKPIFSAVSSLMKAQAYELSALPICKKAPSVYQFNLLSVVDTDLVRLMFKGSEIECSPLETEHYLARYIIRKRETFSRIRFIKASAFSSTLHDYGRLHQANCKWFGAECDAFYSGILTNYTRTSVLIENFRKKIEWHVSWQLERQFGWQVELGKTSVNWSELKKQPWLGVDVPENVLAFLNSDPKITELVSDALNKVFRYKGSFYFSDDIPF
jgi:hypothetical protein